MGLSFKSGAGSLGRVMGAPVLLAALAGLPIAAAVPAMAQSGVSADDPLHGGLPFADARLDRDGAPLPAVQQSIAAAHAMNPARAADIAALKAAIPLLQVDDHPLFGTPHYVRSTADFLTPASKVGALGVVNAFIDAHPALFEVPSAEIAKSRTARDFLTDHNGVRHLTFQQQLGGIDLFGCEVRANVMPDGRLINISSSMLPRPDQDFAAPAPVLTDAQAIEAAARACGVKATLANTPRTEPEGASQKRVWNNSKDFRADEPITTEMVYFPVTRGDIRAAWQVVVPVKGGDGHTYDVIVDAGTGDLLYRTDRLCYDSTQPISMRVYTTGGVGPLSPSRNSPDGFQAPFATRQLVTVTPAQMIPFSPNGWIDDGGTETLGNNVDAHLDRDGTANSPDLPRPNGGASRVFDFPYDPAVEPVGQGNPAVTQLFYYGNLYHDKIYALGFNEAAGNFQQTNFSGMGSGNDRVQADAQDGSGTNNANFGTSGTDGSTARCQMYIFTGPTPDRDGDYDADIVYHEFTHGTSIRLHHGLSGTQPQGMGEGWSDFVAIALQYNPATDNVDAPHCTGGFTTLNLGSGFVNNYFYGIRRYPYSVSLGLYPLTFADIDTTQFNTAGGTYPGNPLFIGNAANEVHNVGEVWCNMLMDVRASLVRAHTADGNQRALQGVIDGMKLSVANPNFIQARDAVLQALLTDYGAADKATAYAAFARHGLGYSATSPASSTTTGVHEAFDLPQFITFTYPGGTPSQLLPGVPVSFEVDTAPTDLTITPGTGQIFYSVNGAAFTSSSLTPIAANRFTATIPGQPCLANVRYYISFATSAGPRTDPGTAPTDTFVAQVFNSTLVSDSFEAANAGWVVTAGSPAATTGLWTRMASQATAAQPGGGHTGANCWVTDGRSGTGVGDFDVDGGQTILTSPAFDLSASAAGARISYFRWFSNNQGNNPGTNTFLVQVSTNNGTTWTTAETVGPSGAGTTGGWVQASWTLASLGLTPSSQVKLRFTAQDITTAVVEAAIDDLLIVGCTATPACGTADYNGDGDVGTDQDIEAFFRCLAGSCCATCFPGGADFNGDGDIGTDADIESFFRVLAGGNC